MRRRFGLAHSRLDVEVRSQLGWRWTGNLGNQIGTHELAGSDTNPAR
jgi:hypothetical protein